MLFLSHMSFAQDVRVATSSNFRPTLERLALKFEQQSPYRIEIVSASTGTLTNQLLNGAPFDIFFAADANSIALLAEHRILIPHSIATYAFGKLVVFGNRAKTRRLASIATAESIVIANPNTAPYGRLAINFLEHFNLVDSVKIIQVGSVSQAYQIAKLGHADAAIVAESLVTIEEDVWIIPLSDYQPLNQQVGIVASCQMCEGAKQLADFVLSKAGQQIISESGYGVIGVTDE